MAGAFMLGGAEAQTSAKAPAVLPGVLYGVNAAGELLAIDPAGFAERKVGPIGIPKVNALAYDNRTDTLYGLAEDGKLLVIDQRTGTGKLIQTLVVTGRSLFSSLAFEPTESGGRLYAANAVEGRELFRIDLGRTPPHPVVRVGPTLDNGFLAQVTGLAIQPGTGRLYGIQRNRNALGILASATGSFEKVFPNCGVNNPEGLAFESGTGILYGVFSPGTLGVYDLATGLAKAVSRTTSTTALAYALRPSAPGPAVVTGTPAGSVPPPAPGPRHPKLASVLVEVIDVYAANPRQGLALATSRGLLVEREQEVLVEIQVDPRAEQRARVFLDASGMRLRHQVAAGLYEAWLPILKIRGIADNGDIQFIQPARLAQPLGASTTQGLGVIDAAPWHTAGFKGAGVTIANIDTGFTGYAARQASGDWPSGSQVTLIDTNGGGFGNTPGSHGVATVEINFDIAPEAQYRIYDTTTLGDWISALNNAAANGADVVSVSLGAPLDGIGDGTAFPGSVAAAAQAARLQGTLVVNAAGNSRQTHWGGLYSDSTAAPGTHDWGGNSNVNYGIYCQPAGKPLQIELFWDDWTAVSHDYNLYLYELSSSGWVPRASSQNVQNGGSGQKPQEWISYTVSSPFAAGGCPGGTGAFGVVVVKAVATSNRNLQLFTNLELKWPVPARSLGFPADSPGVMTVAAVDVNSSFPQEPYSSEGPVLGPGGSLAASTIEKPDIAAYANVDTQAYGPGFNGTSAATPHVAGAAALVLQAYPQYNNRPDQLQRQLEECAIDLGSPGQDTRHGAGRLVLCSDVRTRDNATDAGAEPHTAGVIWNSLDIRLCTTPNCSADQDPDFGNPAYIYVTLTNGPPAQATNGTLFVYYTAFGGAAQWNPIPTGNVYGDWTLINIGGTSVSLLPGQVSTVVPINWNTVPAPGHYCLLTRWVSSQDPMAFLEGPQTTTNVQNNNNISWKNFNVVDLLMKMSDTAEFVVRNVDRERREVDLELRANGNFVADGALLTVRLGDLFAGWREAGAKGRNVTVQAPDLVRLTGTPAAILGIPMKAGEAAAIEVSTTARAPVPHPGTSHTYQVALTQGTDGKVLGGATYSLVTRARDTDTDGDRVPDVRDRDDDGDGVPDAQDADPVDSTVGRKGRAECMIDLARNRHTCGGIPGVELIAAPAGGMALVKLTLDPATSGFDRAVFTVEFGATPSGWSLNIGDSISNDGHGGDAGNQTYSAEVQILEKDFSVFANDLLLPNPLRLVLVENMAGSGKAIQVEVADGFIGWKSPGVTGQLDSPYLFGLSGQPDAEGPTNRDIYAAFNRTISGREDRTGTGVRRVRIQLIPRPPKAPVKPASGAPPASPES